MKENDLRITRISTIEIDFKSRLEACLKREMLDNDEIYQKVTSVLEGVRQQGDIAVLEYTNKFDNFSVESFQDLVVTPNQLEDSLKRIPESQRNALEHAANRIQKYHERQVTSSWQYEDEDGSVLGQKVTPLERVGIYVPGGKANYPSSMLMLAIPARVAGVKDIIAAVPTRYDTKNDLIFAAAKVAGVNHVLTMGGAQAVGIAVGGGGGGQLGQSDDMALRDMGGVLSARVPLTLGPTARTMDGRTRLECVRYSGVEGRGSESRGSRTEGRGEAEGRFPRVSNITSRHFLSARQARDGAGSVAWAVAGWRPAITN